MSSARKIKARRKGQQQEEAAQTRGARKPPARPGWTGRPLFPPDATIEYAPNLLEKSLNDYLTSTTPREVMDPPRPYLFPASQANRMRALLTSIQPVEPVLKEVYLNTRDIARMAAAHGPLPAHSVDMARVVSHFMGVLIREDRRIPQGGAVGVFSDGQVQYFPPNT